MIQNLAKLECKTWNTNMHFNLIIFMDFQIWQFVNLKNKNRQSAIFQFSQKVKQTRDTQKSFLEFVKRNDWFWAHATLVNQARFQLIPIVFLYSFLHIDLMTNSRKLKIRDKIHFWAKKFKIPKSKFSVKIRFFSPFLFFIFQFWQLKIFFC